MLTCPNDQTALAPVTIEDVALDQCPTCGGYWLQRGELEALGERHDAHLDPIKVGRVGTVDSTRKCPLDGTQLVQHEFVEHTGIKIDQCRKCQGIWLEKFELSNLLKYLDTEGIHRDPTMTQRVMLFLFQLVRYPPYY